MHPYRTRGLGRPGLAARFGQPCPRPERPGRIGQGRGAAQGHGLPRRCAQQHHLLRRAGFGGRLLHDREARALERRAGAARTRWAGPGRAARRPRGRRPEALVRHAARRVRLGGHHVPPGRRGGARGRRRRGAPARHLSRAHRRAAPHHPARPVVGRGRGGQGRRAVHSSHGGRNALRRRAADQRRAGRRHAFVRLSHRLARALPVPVPQPPAPGRAALRPEPGPARRRDHEARRHCRACERMPGAKPASGAPHSRAAGQDRHHHPRHPDSGQRHPVAHRLGHAALPGHLIAAHGRRQPIWQRRGGVHGVVGRRGTERWRAALPGRPGGVRALRARQRPHGPHPRAGAQHQMGGRPDRVR